MSDARDVVIAGLETRILTAYATLILNCAEESGLVMNGHEAHELAEELIARNGMLGDIGLLRLAVVATVERWENEPIPRDLPGQEPLPDLGTTPAT